MAEQVPVERIGTKEVLVEIEKQVPVDKIVYVDKQVVTAVVRRSLLL